MNTPPPSPTNGDKERDRLFGVDMGQWTIDLNQPPPASPEEEEDTDQQLPQPPPTPTDGDNNVVGGSTDRLVNEAAAILHSIGAAGGGGGGGRAPVIDLSSDDDEVVEVDAPVEEEQRIMCLICRGSSMRDPTATICGHVFCRICIMNALGLKRKCPACRTPLRGGDRSLFRIYLS